jgi:hypothetical protein
MVFVTSDLSISLHGFFRPARPVARAPVRRGVDLHRWMFETADENTEELDATLGAGAYVMGRNMFGPDRGEWDSTGPGGGGPNRLTMLPCSCSLTSRAILSSSTRARRSNSSPTASRPPWGGPRRWP